MPYANEHAARIKEPSLFMDGKDDWGSKEITDGVRIIEGKLKSNSNWEVQTYRFDADKFSPSEAKKWLKEHKVDYISFETAIGGKSENIYLLPINGVIGQDFKFTDLLMHLNAAKNSTTIKLVISSPGGYVNEADKIREAIEKSGKEIHATNSGDIASAAVSIFLTADKINRTFNPKKGIFLIHMPFVDGKDGGVTGTAEEIQQAADTLKKLNKEALSYYHKRTGTEQNILEGFMQENIPLTEPQIESLGFATIIKEETFKAVAYYKPNNFTDMTPQEIDQKFGKLETLINKVIAFFKPKNIMLQDTNGNELDFGADIKEAAQIVVGVSATVKGAPAEGEFTMQDGTKYTFKQGKLEAITPPEKPEEELIKVKTENAALKVESTAKDAKIQELEKFKVDSLAEVNKVKEEFKSFRSQFSKDNPATTGKKDDEVVTIRKAFKVKSA